MCRTQSVLALLALYVGLAHSWEIAVSLKEQLIFYSNNGSKTDTVNLTSKNPTSLVFDELHNRMLYVDKQNEDDAVCSYDISSREDKCLTTRNGRNIYGLAFDPVTELVFFTDIKERSINWISLKPGSHNIVYGNLLLKMDDRTPTDIAVDSCQGYIYWTDSNKSKDDGLMGKVRFDGSGRENILQGWYFSMAGLAIDSQEGRMYHLSGCQLCSPSYIRSSELDGSYVIVIHEIKVNATVSKLMTITKDNVYWVSDNTVWKTTKIWKDEEPTVISKFHVETPIGIVANYKMVDQDCEALSSLIHTQTLSNSSDSEQKTGTAQTTEANLFCVHGTKVNEISVCNCSPGYIGERCDVSICENYCLHGTCAFNDLGTPNCSCNAGYSGQRCEVDVCRGYCLNNGDCSLNVEGDPVCQCDGNHDGSRCECVKNNFTFTNTAMDDSVKRNVTLADILSSWRATNSKMFVTINNY